MNPVVVDIKNYLVSEEIVYFLGDTPQNPHALDFACAMFYEPDMPNKCITLYDTPGTVQSITFSKQTLESESFQVRSRAKTYVEAYNKLEAIRVALNAIIKLYPTGEAYRYESFNQSSTILPIGQDDKKRFLLTLNYNTMRVNK